MKKFFKLFIFTVLILLVVLLFWGYYIKDKNENPTEPQQQTVTNTRDAKNDDLTSYEAIHSKDGKSVTIRFIPKHDIENLKLKVLLSDSSNYLLDSQIITVGNVVEGQQYTVRATLPDNAFTKDKSIYYCEVSVNEGKITYSYQTGPGIYIN